MTEIPQVNPRNIPDGLASVVETHKQHHQRIHEMARRVAEEHAQRDKELNAQARLDGRTP